MRRLTKLALGALFAGGSRLPALAEDGVTATEIVIGSHTALSGPVSAWGIGSTEGTRLRFDEANEKGIHGRKIRLMVEDHSIRRRAPCRPPTSSSTATRSSSCWARSARRRTTPCSASSCQGGAQHLPLHGRALDGRALPQAEVRAVLHLLRPGARRHQALRGEAGQEEGVLAVPGHRLRPRDP